MRRVFLPVEPQPPLEADDGDVVLQRLVLEPRVDVEGASLQNLFFKKNKKREKRTKNMRKRMSHACSRPSLTLRLCSPATILSLLALVR